MLAGPLFVVSPHLDDAVLSCGATLALHPGSTVCTVFAGKPVRAMITPWDREAGFTNSDEAMGRRYLEDGMALARCGASGLHLPFLDSQYGHSPTPQDIADALCDIWPAYPEHAIVIPMGLWHSDHVLASDGCFQAVARSKANHYVVYEEALYRAIPNVADTRRAALEKKGISMMLISNDASDTDVNARAKVMQQKWLAVDAYASQLRALHDLHPQDVGAPERYWRPFV